MIQRVALALAATGILFPTSALGQQPPSIPAAATHASSAADRADPATLAIMEFDFAAVHQWWAAELGLGRGIADLITDGLVNDNAYRVIERRFLESILAEQDLAADKQRSDPSAANLARAGKLLGAQYLVVGSVTRFGTENETKGGAGGLFGRAVGGGLFTREKGKAVVGITARVVDAATGVVVASVTGEGMSSRAGLLLGGLGPEGFGGVSMRSSAFRETVLGEATERAVRRIVEGLAAAKPVAGYRVVALETRDVDEKTTNEPVVGGLLGKVLGKGWTVEKHRLRRELIVLFEKATEAPAVETVREAARRYHLVTAATEAEFEEMLNRAATAGYRLLTTAPNAFPEVTAVVEKQASGAGRPTYGVLAPNKISTLANELARAGAAGWVPHSRGLLDPSGGRHDLAPALIVVERKQQAPAGKYLVLAAKRTSTLDKELNQAAAVGLELVMGGRGRGELLLVMKR
jgi:curli biogenesis system outer membrane secretion channel CsgG